MDLVYIEWEDASSVDETTGWVFREDAPIPEKHIFCQVGFVVDMDLEALILTEAYSSNQTAPRTRIPLGMLRRVVRLDPDKGEPVEL